jgi:hypothetical protein
VLLQIGLRQVAKIMAADPANLQGLAEVFAALQGEQGLVAPLPAAVTALASFDASTAAAAAAAPGGTVVAAAAAAAKAATASLAAVHGAIPLEAIRGLLVDGTYELSEVEVRAGYVVTVCLSVLLMCGGCKDRGLQLHLKITVSYSQSTRANPQRVWSVAALLCSTVLGWC